MYKQTTIAQEKKSSNECLLLCLRDLIVVVHVPVSADISFISFRCVLISMLERIWVCITMRIPFCYFDLQSKASLFCSKYSHQLSRSVQIYKSCVYVASGIWIEKRTLLLFGIEYEHFLNRFPSSHINNVSQSFYYFHLFSINIFYFYFDVFAFHLKIRRFNECWLPHQFQY